VEDGPDQDPEPRPSYAAKARGATEAAILSAAAELFAERSPARVSIREIAARAEVNHSLVHRYFGTKAQLLDAVIRESSRSYTAAIETSDDPAESFRAGFLYAGQEDPAAAALARAVLDGSVRVGEGGGFPGMARHIALLDDAIAKRGAIAAHPPAIIAASAFAFIGGWFILEDWLVPAAGLQDRDRDALRREVADLLGNFIADAAGLDRQQSENLPADLASEIPAGGLGDAVDEEPLQAELDRTRS
jgi:TetR/AcrR family transcriptional regulator, repressor for neighboring sulfatase